MKYQVTWHDTLRHIANCLFVGSYLCFEHGYVLPAATCTLVAESLLIPSAIKQKSWSTIASSALFLGLALSTLGRGLFV